MKRLFTALVIGSFLCVGACGTTGGIGADIPNASSTLADEKALIGLEASAIAINQAAELAVDTGILRPGSDQAIQVADALVRVRQGVLLARQAQVAGDATQTTTRVLATLSLIGEINNLIR